MQTAGKSPAPTGAPDRREENEAEVDGSSRRREEVARDPGCIENRRSHEDADRWLGPRLRMEGGWEFGMDGISDGFSRDGT
jgi:hypothetical protein